jgi:hypothetical protein
MSAHDAEERLRELMRATTLDPPLRPDLPERVRVGARRRRRLQQGGAALCVVLAAVSGAVIARTWDARPGGSRAVSLGGCAGTVVTVTAGTQRVVLPGHGAQELTVKLGDSVRFVATGRCSARVALTSDAENLIGHTVSFPSTTGTLVADAAKLGTETTPVTVTSCPTAGSAAGCADAVVVGVITVRVTSQPTP